MKKKPKDQSLSEIEKMAIKMDKSMVEFLKDNNESGDLIETIKEVSRKETLEEIEKCLPKRIEYTRDDSDMNYEIGGHNKLLEEIQSKIKELLTKDK